MTLLARPTAALVGEWRRGVGGAPRRGNVELRPCAGVTQLQWSSCGLRTRFYSASKPRGPPHAAWRHSRSTHATPRRGCLCLEVHARSKPRGRSRRRPPPRPAARPAPTQHAQRGGSRRGLRWSACGRSGLPTSAPRRRSCARSRSPLPTVRSARRTAASWKPRPGGASDSTRLTRPPTRGRPPRRCAATASSSSPSPQHALRTACSRVAAAAHAVGHHGRAGRRRRAAGRA